MDKSKEEVNCKRKNEFDNENNSNSGTEESKTETKKLKIPIKLSVSIGKAKESPSTTSSSSNKDDKNDKSNSKSEKEGVKTSIAVIPKLPTGCLAPSKIQPIAVVKNVSEKVAKVFGSDDDDDETEMPIEARMKMRNIGRNTPTSTGPNSYGKTQLGFCDSRKLFEKQLKEQSDALLKQEAEKEKEFTN